MNQQHNLIIMGDIMTVQNARLKIQATIASVLTAFTILIIKIYAYIMTGSMAMMAGVMDSTMDVFASLSMAYAMVHAVRPPDACHRFGHGKAEGLASMFQACFIIVAGIFLGYQSILRFFQPQAISEEFLGIALTGVVLVLTITLVMFQSYVIRKTNSVGVESDSLHYKGDVLMNIGVIITLGVAYFMDTAYVDIVFGVGIAVYFIYNGFGIFKKALDILMDKELSESKRIAIEKCVIDHPKALGLHDLRTRSTGGQDFIEFHLEMDGTMSLSQAHTIAHEVEDKIKTVFPDATVIIHQEPAGIKDKRLDDEIKKAVGE